MQQKYALAIKAGTIMAIVLIILTLIGNILTNIIGGPQFYQEARQWQERYGTSGTAPTETPEMPSMGFMAVGIGYLFILALMLVAYAGAGVLAARMATYTSLADAAILGAIAGIVSELIHRPVAMVLAIVFNVLAPYDASSTAGSILGSIAANIICCLPTLAVIGGILGAIGAVIYALLIKKPAGTAVVA